MKHYHKQKGLAEVIFDALVGLVTYPFRKRKNLFHNKISRSESIERWQKIEEMAELGGEAHFKQAIIEADNLADLALKSAGISGQTMGERLKNARNRFSEPVYQDLWQAHKVRNDIVHEHDREILQVEAENTLHKFKKALNELGLL